MFSFVTTHLNCSQVGVFAIFLCRVVKSFAPTMKVSQV